MASTKVAVIDDWQNAASDLIDWSPLKKRADITFFQRHFGPGEENVAADLLERFRHHPAHCASARAFRRR